MQEIILWFISWKTEILFIIFMVATFLTITYITPCYLHDPTKRKKNFQCNWCGQLRKCQKMWTENDKNDSIMS